jgi:hypothetical protein
MHESPPDDFKKLKIRLWLVAWGIALAGTTIPILSKDLTMLPYFVMSIWAFPIGTIAFALPVGFQQPDGVLVYWLIAGGWLFYAFLTVFGLSQRNRLGYYIVHATLCLLLVLNAVGCNVNMMKGGNWHV